MLRLPPFDYHVAQSAADAAALLAGEGAAEGRAVRLVAGGTDLFPNMKRRHQRADVVVSLMRAPGLAGVGGGDGRELAIGATTTLAAVAADRRVRGAYPALAEAVASISTPVLRNMGTLGGNLCLDTRCTYYNQNEEWRQAIGYCMKEAGTVCWVAPSSPRCWAIAASDSAPMLCALGARVRLVSTAGERELPLAAIYREDGIHYLAKRPDEVLTSVLLPAEAAAGRCRSAFYKLRRRGAIDFAVLSLGAALWTDASGAVERASLFLGAVASAPIEITAATEALVGRPLGPASIAAAGRAARRAATPMDNTDFQTQWRGTMIEKQVVRTLTGLAGHATPSAVG